jgi:hypothetical protein
VKELVGEVKTLNHRFDQLTRKAMKELSAGRDAQAEIEGARSTLDLLTLKVGDLPQAHVPSSPTDVPKTSKPSP